MAEQQRDGAAAADTSDTSDTTETGSAGSGGRHAAAEDAPTATTSDASEAPTTTTGGASEAPTTTTSGAGEAPTQAVSASEAPTRTVDPPTRAVSEPPTAVVAAPQAERPADPPPGRPRRSLDGPPAIGKAVRAIVNPIGTVLSAIGLLCAAVLVVFIVLALIGVNPQNGAAQFIGSAADVLVLDFRDLFLIPDPPVAVVVNYGLAAVFWVVVGTVAARIVRALGRLVP